MPVLGSFTRRALWRQLQRIDSTSVVVGAIRGEARLGKTCALTKRSQAIRMGVRDEEEED